jgi:hypothetical protein
MHAATSTRRSGRGRAALLALALTAGCSRFHLLGSVEGQKHDGGGDVPSDSLDTGQESESADAGPDAPVGLDASDAEAEAAAAPEPDASLDARDAGGDRDARDAGGDGVAVSAADASDAGPTSLVQLAAGMDHACALRADGTMWCWGGGDLGQLGDDTTPLSRSEPGPVPALGNDIISIACGAYHTMAITSDHSLWLWGSNGYGQLGDGSMQERHVPWRSPTLGGAVAAVSAGERNTCVLKTDGTVWCWGWNLYGQVGDGTTMDRDVPVQVKNLGNTVAEVSRSCARKLDGSLWCWGTPPPHSYNDYLVTPEQVVSLGNSVAHVVANDGSNICVQKMDGTVWCWGFVIQNDGTPALVPAPVQMTTLGTTVVELSMGDYHTCARKADGTVWCWGGNNQGQLGNGTRDSSTTPLQVTALGGDVVEVVSGQERSCARKADGTVWCWGLMAEGDIVELQPIPSTPTPVKVTFPF